MNFSHFCGFGCKNKIRYCCQSNCTGASYMHHTQQSHGRSSPDVGPCEFLNSLCGDGKIVSSTVVKKQPAYIQR